ncbi:multiple epidermal growth factor-like domains protein 10 [Mercenaria mercenaria]|uniref:multiple epidermal growth factor-like domains protein 10 n=1 Tax=Mercenaria mercenaria TaxID=6596 RepID=UPI00234F18B0|nr:multiple epidermal growth factor-like domains protein 10 [Mercenaria mercenaria]
MTVMLTTLIPLLVIECISRGKYFVFAVLNETCKTNECSICCVDKICAQGNYPNDCTNGCIDGHRGARCYELCTYNCKSCKNNIDICESCYDGFYLGDRKDCASKCPPNCKTCSSNLHCNTCKAGFYDKGGSSTCDYSICPTHCECDETNCVACKNGYYDIENSCNKACPLNCLACSTFKQCSQCQNGFYNGYGIHSDINVLLNDCTYKCRDACINCSSYDNCVKCQAGKYGLQCQENCSVGCKEKICLIETGKCNCTSNFSGEKCTECVTGKYGNLCELLCPNNCNNTICHRLSGNCTDGCVNETMSGAKCYGCVVGRYGNLCENICSENCKNRKCDKDNGDCTDGCEANFNGTTCTECITGRYGDKCQYICPDTCADDMCKMQSGDCFQCTGNFDGNKCDSCKPGFHGLNCDQNCSRNCLNNSCDKISGTCKNGCKSNYSGDKCCVNNNNCIYCSSNTECQECKSGFFGDSCNKTCSSLCIDNVCSQEKGVCIKGCSGSHEDPACPVSLGQTSTTSPSIGPIAGGVSGAALAVIIGIVFAVFFVKRRRTGKPSEQQNDGARTEHAREGPVYENYRETQLLEDDEERNSYATRKDSNTAVDVNEVEIDERSNDAASRPSETYYNFRPNSHRVKVNVLFSYVTEHVDSFANEFGNLAKDLDLTQHCTFAKKPENLPLNRYNGIYPYDHSRVTISAQPGFFINACYIDGYNNRKKAYIASLGPTAKTTDKFSTFWLMVWNEKSDIIVMLTNLREASGMKCENYWPDSDKEEVYGQIRATCRSIEDFAEYTVRTLSISKD